MHPCFHGVLFSALQATISGTGNLTAIECRFLNKDFDVVWAISLRVCGCEFEGTHGDRLGNDRESTGRKESITSMFTWICPGLLAPSVSVLTSMWPGKDIARNASGQGTRVEDLGEFWVYG